LDGEVVYFGGWSLGKVVGEILVFGEDEENWKMKGGGVGARGVEYQ